MRRVLVMGVLLGALSTPAVATAETSPFDAEGLHDYDIATAYWGGPPTECSTVTLLYSSALPSGGRATQPRGEVVPCVLEVSTELNGDTLCKLIVHEAGHLHGLGHSTDPHS